MTAVIRRVYVALLRAVNVGGRHRLPSVVLRAAAERAGFGDVETYLQSGNVIFTASARPAAQISRGLNTALRDEVAFDIPVVVRSAAELRTIVAAHPFGASAEHVGKHGLVAFYDRPLDESVKQSLQRYRADGETLSFGVAEVFAYLPDGFGRSKLGNALHKKSSGFVATVRNWNTVVALARLAQELQER